MIGSRLQNIILEKSVLTEIEYCNINFSILRDDLIHPLINGNKARKFSYYIQKNPSDLTTLISYGGYQSNAMYALSCLCNLKQWNFIYHTGKIPSWLKKEKLGNLKGSLENGMLLIEHDKKSYNHFVTHINEFELKNKEALVQQGGFEKESEKGFIDLAQHIQNLESSNRPQQIFLTSGTGTSALFLQKHLDIPVITCPVLGNRPFLLKQFHSLEPDLPYYPEIIETKKGYPFAQPHPDIYCTYLYFKNQGIEFDLIYDCTGWIAIKENIEKFLDKKTLFIHSGGLSGNESMLKRYSRNDYF